jgi:hypothetical protein
MQVILKRFGQEVDLENPKKVVHTLVFDVGGKQLSLPVQEETIKTLVGELYSKAQPEEGAPSAPKGPYRPPEDPEDPRHSDEDLVHASEFGGGGADEVPAEATQAQSEPEAQDASCPNCGEEPYDSERTCPKCGFWDGPENEEEVKSL